jgi:carboxymethylenebutenolidase
MTSLRSDLPSGTACSVAIPTAAAIRGVVVIPDIAGLRPLFDDLVARLAADYGWAVAAIEPFPGHDLPTIEDRFAAVPKLDDARLLGDATAAADLLVAQSGVERVAVIGFCMGGMYAYKAAGTGRFDRAAPFYGMIRLPADWEGPGHRQPLDCLASPGVCPVLSIIGGKDPYTPAEDVAELARFGNVTPVVYPEAEHGFVHDASRPSHRAGDAADAWTRVAAFLA